MVLLWLIAMKGDGKAFWSLLRAVRWSDHEQGCRQRACWWNDKAWKDKSGYDIAYVILDKGLTLLTTLLSWLGDYRKIVILPRFSDSLSIDMISGSSSCSSNEFNASSEWKACLFIPNSRQRTDAADSLSTWCSFCSGRSEVSKSSCQYFSLNVHEE